MEVDSRKNKEFLWNMLNENGSLSKFESPEKAKSALDQAASRIALTGLTLVEANKAIIKEVLANGPAPDRSYDTGAPLNPFVPQKGNPTFSDAIDTSVPSLQDLQRAIEGREEFDLPAPVGVQQHESSTPDELRNSSSLGGQELNDFLTSIAAGDDLPDRLARLEKGQELIIEMLSSMNSRRELGSQ